MIEAGYAYFACRWLPILDHFEKESVKFALEVHPTEIAYDIHTTKRALEAVDYHPSFGINFDPSHLVHQLINPVEFINTLEDRIPFDLGGSPMSGIHITAYEKLIKYLGFDDLNAEVYDHIQQLALPHEQVLKRLEVDIRSIRPSNPKSYNLDIQKIGDYTEYTDEWGVGWRKPIVGGLYYDMVFHPLEYAQDHRGDRGLSLDKSE